MNWFDLRKETNILNLEGKTLTTIIIKSCDIDYSSENLIFLSFLNIDNYCIHVTARMTQELLVVEKKQALCDMVCLQHLVTSLNVSLMPTHQEYKGSAGKCSSPKSKEITQVNCNKLKDCRWLAMDPGEIWILYIRCMQEISRVQYGIC